MQSFATKAKRAITKVAALGTGIAMMGTTLTGALALSTKLSDFPAAFKDAMVVVGTAASGADDTAAASIAADIPTTAKVTQISGDTYTIEKSGNSWNINQDMAAIDNSITDTELDLLAKQTFKDDQGTNTADTDYTQTLAISNNATQLVFNQDTSDNRVNNPSDTYLKISSAEGRWTWNYTIKFTGSAMKIKDAADLESNVLSMLGRDWTITDVSTNTSYGTIDKMTLLAGDVLSSIVQGSTVGGVTVVDVDEASTKCVIEYAGKTYILDKGQTKTMDDGTIVGVTDVTAIHAAGAASDMCELAIGAHKLVLENGKKANVNNEDVDNSLVYISGSSTVANTAGLKQIIVSYQPSDTMWLLPGESLEDPIFGAFKIVYNDLIEKNPETIKVDPVGDKIRLTMKNRDGDTFDDYYCYLNGTGTNRQLRLGYSSSKQMAIFNGQNITNNTVGTEGTWNTPKGLKGTRFLFTFSGLSHIAEITDIDSANSKTTIKLLDSGEVYKDMDYTDGAGNTFSDINSNLNLGYNINLFGGIALVAGKDGASINFSKINDNGPTWFTYNDANITFLNSSGGTLVDGNKNPNPGALSDSSGCDLMFSEQGYSSKSVDSDVVVLGGHGNANGALNISFNYDASNDIIKWNQTGSGALGASTALKIKDDASQYDYVGRTIYGTKIAMYQKNDGDLELYYPAESVKAEVMIAASTAVKGTMGTLTPVLETDVKDATAQNLILVGGPCANALTAKFTGEGTTFPDCNKDYTAGQAMLKLFDNGNKVALVVAGYGADDTQRAAVALGKGSSLPSKTSATVSGTSLELSQITVA